MKSEKKIVEFTCAVCPNGCHLSVEVDGDVFCQAVETGRCVRGNYLIGKEFYLDGDRLVKLDTPMARSKVWELVDQRRAENLKT